MKNIFLNGLNNVTPTELNKQHIKSFYYYFAPTELTIKNEENVSAPEGEIAIENNSYQDQAP